MKALSYICFGWLLTVLVSWCAGKLLFRRLSVRLHRQEEGVLAFLLGSACLSMLIFLICVIHLAYKPVFLAIALAAIAAGIQQRIWQPSGKSLPCLSGPWRLLFYTVYVCFAAVYLVNAFAPESSPDGTSYHLGFVAQYARARGFLTITDNFYANLPQGMEMLFLFAFVWGRHSAAALGCGTGPLHIFASVAISDFELWPAPQDACGWRGRRLAGFRRTHCGNNRHDCV